MVRVISVHHFASQHIQTVEQPTACTVAPPDKLLLALTNNCIEVRDLKNESDVLFTFPSVDEVIQIVHCRNGDYVATLETKFNRQNKDTNFVRVYINWDSVAAMQQSKMTSSGISLGSSECGMVQPMRARIAGRVTPTTNQSELGSLEMIEIPVKKNPDLIECCQISGNLVIVAKRSVAIYQFQVRTHDISKMRFIDFEEIGLSVGLPFLPVQVSLTEDYLAAVNRDSMYLCRLVVKEKAEQSGAGDDAEFAFSAPQDEAIDFMKLIADEQLRSNLNKAKVTVNLPSIVRDNSIIHKHSPFTFSDKEMTATIAMSSAHEQYEIKNLIQLKLVPILVESAQRQITEEFKCMILKPLYIDETLNKSTTSTPQPSKFLKSDFKKCLNSVVCMVATQQEGYLYFFTNNSTENESIDNDNCIAVYPFTAPVQRIVMEDYFLHALTETGLESYTLRFGHKLCRSFEVVDNLNIACPSINDSICLVGLRPFLGVERILLSGSNLVLLANSESSPTHSVSSSSSSNAAYWTLYNLELPQPKTIFNDISIVANLHRFTSTQTYCHLMSEAHVVLRVALLLKKWTSAEDTVGLVMSQKGNNDDVVETYRTSCALLADHYIMCYCEEEYALAIAYYKMARVLPFEVLRRVKKIQEQCNNHTTKGLIYYLKSVLLEVKHNWEAERFFSGGNKQNFAETILELLENHNYDDLPNLILKSHILREYSTDKLIYILSNKLADDTNNHLKRAEKNLALAILFVQKCSVKMAQDSLDNIPKNSLETLIKLHWDLLLENTAANNFQTKPKSITTFSELAVILISSQPEMLASVLVWLVMEKKITLNKLIKVFLEYLPSSIGSDSNSASLVLQKSLEMYFEFYYEKIPGEITKIIYERGANEALKLLVRSYLSQLQIFQLKEEKQMRNEEFLKKIDEIMMESDSSERNKPYFDDRVEAIKEDLLFGRYRFGYLNKMAPFQVEITSKLYEVCVENYQTTCKDVHRQNDAADVVLKKLQAILCSPIVSKQIVGEVNAFLCMNENLRGNLSLQTIIMGTNDAVQLLIDVCPQCLLQFGKDRFTKADEWKFLIATVQRRILRLSQNEVLKRVCFFHKKLLKDILTHVATSMTLDQLVQVFPQRFSTSTSENDNNKLNDLNNTTTTNNEYVFLENELDILNEIQNYEPYVIICKETMHANQINKLITTTGQQLLCTLNL